MRIITGLLKGRKIDIPNTLNVRPTTDRTKEGIFSVIDARRYIRNARVLDLFAGSGNLGFEAISRGADSVLFVDQDRKNIQHIERQAEEFEVSDQIRMSSTTVDEFLSIPGVPYDFIFCDPPYTYPGMAEMVQTILDNNWLQPRGWLILEHDKHHDFSDHEKCSIVKKYGRTTVSIFSPDTDTE